MFSFIFSIRLRWSDEPPPDVISLEQRDFSRLPMPQLNELINQKGVTETRLNKYGYVYIDGYRYEAKAVNQSLPSGIWIRVIQIEFNRLVVAPIRFHKYFNSFIYVDELSLNHQ